MATHANELSVLLARFPTIGARLQLVAGVTDDAGELVGGRVMYIGIDPREIELNGAGYVANQGGELLKALSESLADFATEDLDRQGIVHTRAAIDAAIAAPWKIVDMEADPEDL